MFVVETGQIFAVVRTDVCWETGQMSSVARTDIFLVSAHNVEESEDSIAPISECASLRGLNCGNVTVFES